MDDPLSFISQQNLVLFGKEKPPVVFEIGTVQTRCGFAGEAAPRHIVSSGQITTLAALGSVSQSREDWVEAVEELFNTIFFQLLQVNPKDRRVVVCASLLFPSELLELAVTYVLFEKLKSPSVLFVPCEQLCLLPLSVASGLVVDVGNWESRVLPIYEGCAVSHALQAAPLGMRAVQRRLSSLLGDLCTLRDTQTGAVSPAVDVPPASLANLLASVCYVEQRADAIEPGDAPSSAKSPAADVSPPAVSPAELLSYPLSSRSVLQLHPAARSQAANVLFEADDEDASLATLVLAALRKCPADTRRELIASIVLVGGGAMLPGLRQRLGDELRRLLLSNENADLKALRSHVGFTVGPYAANCLAWLGGAVVACLNYCSTHSISRETR